MTTTAQTDAPQDGRSRKGVSSPSRAGDRRRVPRTPCPRSTTSRVRHRARWFHAHRARRWRSRSATGASAASACSRRTGSCAARRSVTSVAASRSRSQRRARPCLQRVGQPLDTDRSRESRSAGDPPRRAGVRSAGAAAQMFETGIKVIDLLEPYVQAEKSASSAVPAWARPSSFRR